MAGFKETPRQKMIGMMYLVLTALLALNVSVEILNAFIVVNESIEDTNEKFEAKIDETYADFAQQYSINKEKTKKYYESAQEVKALTKGMVDYINNVKLEAIAKNERKSVDEIKGVPLRDLKSKDKFDAVTTYFIGPKNKGEAYTLSAKLDEYRTKLMSYLGKDAKNKDLGIHTNTDSQGKEIVYYDRDDMKQSWEHHNFYHTILAADITILNKIITEVKNAEYDVVSYLYGQISESDFKFSEIQAKVIPTSNYVLLGDTYEADIIVAAYDTMAQPSVLVKNGTETWKPSYARSSKKVSGNNGMVKFAEKATSEGLKTYSGVVLVKDPVTGVEQQYPFASEYTVARPSLTVSAMKMNVFYIGVPNPVSISVPGVPASSLNATISKGTLKTKDGNYEVNMPSGSEGKVNINVSAKVNGVNKNMGSAEFRVKRLPSPNATVANVDGGQISKSRLNAASAIIPTMPADFDFEANFVITRFTMISLSGGDIVPIQTSGNKITPRMKNVIRGLKRGQKVWFEDIFAKGPDGTTRKLNTISLTLN